MKLRIIILVFGLLAVQPAWAQDDAEVEDRAVQHFEDGAELFFEEEYEAAIEEFMKGHRISPNAMFLYNVSLAHVKLGNLGDALEAARAARGLEGLDPTTRVQNEGRIAALEVLENTLEIRRGGAGADESEPITMIPQAQPAESDFGVLGWTGVGLTVVGVGLLTGAALVELDLNDMWTKYEAAGRRGDESEYLSLRADIKDQQTLGLILLASGVGASAAGITMILVDVFSDGEASTSVYAAPRGDSAAFGITGRF